MIRTNAIVAFLFILPFAAPQPSHAQVPASQKYTLDKCIEMGLVRNLNIIMAENAVVSAQSQKLQAWGAFVPSLNGSLNWSHSDQDQSIFRNNVLITSRDNFSARISSGLTLFDGMANIATVDQSILNKQGSEYTLARTKQDITYQIQAGYYNVLRDKQLLATAQENLSRSKQELERIQELNRVGSVPLADVYRQQVVVGQAELAVINADNDEKNARADLAYLVGLKATEDFDVVEMAGAGEIDSVVIRDFRTKIRNYETAVQEAIRNRADYRSAETALRSAEQGVTIARAGYYPSLSASAGYGWSDFELSTFFPDRTKNDAFSVGLTLSIPILSNFRTSSGVEQALVAKQNADENMKQVEREITVTLKKGMNQLEAAEKNIEQARRNLVSTREDLRVAQERYAVGAGTLLDQVTANTSYISAQSDNVNAIFNYYIARRQVEYLIGAGI